MKRYKTISKCKICDSTELTDVIHIPEQHLSATFVEDNAKVEISKIKVPMTLTLCDRNKNPKGCGLLQLREEVEADLLYRQYFYRSAISQTMQDDLREVITDIQSKIDLKPNDIVVDIGANDCTMLGFYPKTFRRVGFEPAQNIDWSHVEKSIQVINNYFNAENFTTAFGKEKARVLSCCAMFYDISDPNSFVSQVRELMADDGMWCMQLSYLPLMLDNMNFYDICHEHLSYYSLAALEILMERNNLKIVDASTNPVNGGSIRAFVTHKANNKLTTAAGTARLEALRAMEKKMNMTSTEVYMEFNQKIEALSKKVRGYMQEQITKGGKVLGLGASTKGNVLIQLFGIDKKMMPAISERNPDKVGLRTLGTDIELISEQAARDTKPATMLVLPWYFKDEIVKREKSYIESGGTLLFPMPYAHVITAQGELRL